MLRTRKKRNPGQSHRPTRQAGGARLPGVFVSASRGGCCRELGGGRRQAVLGAQAWGAKGEIFDSPRTAQADRQVGLTRCQPSRLIITATAAVHSLRQHPLLAGFARRLLPHRRRAAAGSGASGPWAGLWRPGHERELARPIGQGHGGTRVARGAARCVDKGMAAGDVGVHKAGVKCLHIVCSRLGGCAAGPPFCFADETAARARQKTPAHPLGMGGGRADFSAGQPSLKRLPLVWGIRQAAGAASARCH